MKQTRHPAVDEVRDVRPDAQIAEPAVWISRLTVLRELKPGDEYVVRTISFERGLNIIWAPSAQGRGRRKPSGVAGHTAGKTTVVRFLRHVLGEPHFASEAIRSRIRGRFPAGWIVGVVHLSGAPWTVARPFAVGPRPFAVPSSSVDAAFVPSSERRALADYLDQIERATIGPLPVALVPGTNDQITWLNVLAWLTRDQECRFADTLGWRASASESDTPQLSAEGRNFLVRAVLGLISPEEREEQSRNASLVRRKHEATEREPILSHQVGVDNERLRELVRGSVDDRGPLLGSEASAELAASEAQLAVLEKQVREGDRRADAREKFAAAAAHLGRCEERREQVERDLRRARQLLEQMGGTGPAAAFVTLFTNLPPEKDKYCRVPLALAEERGCPLATRAPASLAERRATNAIERDVADLTSVVTAQEKELAEAKRALDDAEHERRDALGALMRANTQFEEGSARVRDERARIRDAHRLLAHAVRARHALASYRDTLEKIDGELAGSRDRQAQLRKTIAKAVGAFSSRYNFVVRRLLGDDVAGRIDTTGRILEPHVEQDGDRASAAIDTVKLLAFDLAAVAHSVEGKGSFPRFLVHDGPREADLAQDVYERLFVVARDLEKAFGQAEPSFQYIVTTTTPPPRELQGDRWVRARLSGARAEDRFLRSDL